MIPIRDGLEIVRDQCISIYLPREAINDSDRKEFVANRSFEDSIKGKAEGIIIFDDILRKSDFIRTYLECSHLLGLQMHDRVLELGADHGWASALIKNQHPSCYVVTSDLVPECIRHAARYESILQVSLDEKWAFSARDTPFAAEQFDCIFTFAAFHHFGNQCDYSEALKEIYRLLKPGGRLVLMYEPSSPKFLHALAYRRVNRRREHEGVDEDVIVPEQMSRLAREIGLELRQVPFPFERYRTSLAATVYYAVLARAGRLSRLVPCTYNYVLRKSR